MIYIRLRRGEFLINCTCCDDKVHVPTRRKCALLTVILFVYETCFNIYHR